MPQPLRPFGLERWNDLGLGYTTTQGLEVLREEIAARHFTKTGKDDMLLDAPGDAMYVAMRALLRPGDHVICTFPGYQSLYETALSIGCEVTHWEAQETAEGVPVFDPASLLTLVRPATRMITVNFPHNPTGFLPSHEEWARVVAAASGVGAYLFADEMYRGLEAEAADRLVPAADAYERGISLGGLSKSVGLPGLRIGWLACRDPEVIKRALEVKDFTTICSSAPSEILALAALRRWDLLMHRQLGILRTNAAALCRFGERWARLLGVYATRGGTIAFPKVLVPGLSVDALADGLLEEEGALIMPGSVYEAPQHAQRLRLGFGRANFPEGLAAFDRYLERHYGEYAVVSE
ncbi:Aspartate aminotransferase [Auxenochlorella protothecoides]|uniref:Aspartate aminotransferase n=1 Tax=Auxenochlorella protothecoides TaxID=3075 RepID=A0A087SLJ2_AUXPR|nr:Aspartate aminotransferase [Auxenochlorella protothecoides]KFM26596.1 Aspartate aminotransferase [Auxenochlorella protothecoides]